MKLRILTLLLLCLAVLLAAGPVLAADPAGSEASPTPTLSATDPAALTSTPTPQVPSSAFSPSLWFIVVVIVVVAVIGFVALVAIRRKQYH